MGSLQIYYQTAEDIPPPHSFQVSAKLSASDAGLKVEISREFTHREEIPLDEIEAEGFRENDSFSWIGTLPKIWSDEILFFENGIQKSNISNFQIQVSDDNGQNAFTPNQADRWIEFSEELLQACLEESGAELPMELVLGQLEKNNFACKP
jgi:hypothetical protein